LSFSLQSIIISIPFSLHLEMGESFCPSSASVFFSSKIACIRCEDCKITIFILPFLICFQFFLVFIWFYDFWMHCCRILFLHVTNLVWFTHGCSKIDFPIFILLTFLFFSLQVHVFCSHNLLGYFISSSFIVYFLFFEYFMVEFCTFMFLISCYIMMYVLKMYMY